MRLPNTVRSLALAAAVATVTIATDLQAAVITVPINRASLIESNGSVQTDEGSPAVGFFDNGDADFNANGGYIFLLPTIPAGEQIDSIVFLSGNSSSYSLPGPLASLPSDLYGFDISTSSVFPATGAYGSGINQPGTKLSTDWFTGTTGPMAGVDITAWVTSTGYVADNYVRLRTGTTANEATITSNGARWWTDRGNAQLTITTSPIPEPTLLGILGMSGLLLLRRRVA